MFPYLYCHKDNELMLQELRGLGLSGKYPGGGQIMKLLRLHERCEGDGERMLWSVKFQKENGSHQRIC